MSNRLLSRMKRGKSPVKSPAKAPVKNPVKSPGAGVIRKPVGNLPIERMISERWDPLKGPYAPLKDFDAWYHLQGKPALLQAKGDSLGDKNIFVIVGTYVDDIFWVCTRYSIVCVQRRQLERVVSNDDLAGKMIARLPENLSALRYTKSGVEDYGEDKRVTRVLYGFKNMNLVEYYPLPSFVNVASDSPTKIEDIQVTFSKNPMEGSDGAINLHGALYSRLVVSQSCGYAYYRNRFFNDASEVEESDSYDGIKHLMFIVREGEVYPSAITSVADSRYQYFYKLFRSSYADRTTK